MLDLAFRFYDPNETISIPDFNKITKLVSLLPEGSPETVKFQGRGNSFFSLHNRNHCFASLNVVLWLNYELSAVTHRFDAMKDYLLQVSLFSSSTYNQLYTQTKQFINKHGPFRRLCSFRNNSITLGELRGYNFEKIYSNASVLSLFSALWKIEFRSLFRR